MMSTGLVLGLLTTTVCLMIQCIFVGAMMQVIFLLEARELLKPSIYRAVSVLTISMLGLFIGNLLQISIWSILFYSIGEFSTVYAAFYHSIVNFTTLGYGDVVMSEKFRLLGGIQALNGSLMIGLTTGFLFMVMSKFMQRSYKKRFLPPDEKA